MVKLRRRKTLELKRMELLRKRINCENQDDEERKPLLHPKRLVAERMVSPGQNFFQNPVRSKVFYLLPFLPARHLVYLEHAYIPTLPFLPRYRKSIVYLLMCVFHFCLWMWWVVVTCIASTFYVEHGVPPLHTTTTHTNRTQVSSKF